MTIADYIEDRRKKAREKLRKESEERGEARGEARAHEEWDGWLARREASETTGEPFSEPPPSRKRSELRSG